MSGPFKVLESRDVYRNPWIHLREDRIIRENGSTGTYGIVTMRPGSSVLAVTTSGEALLVRQYRYAINQETLEVVSGALEPGETPLAAAQRELREEVGYVSDHWIDAGRIDPFTSLVNSPNFLFMALNARKADCLPAEDDELVTPVSMPLAHAIQMAMDGGITHGGSCALLLKADRIIQRAR